MMNKEIENNIDMFKWFFGKESSFNLIGKIILSPVFILFFASQMFFSCFTKWEK